MESHLLFVEELQAMDESTYLRAPEGKWNAGQHLSHLVKSAKAIHTGLVLPRFQLKVMFGTANRPSRTYEGLVEKYQTKLAEGYENKNAYMPAEVSISDRKELSDKLMSYASLIGKRVEGYKEDELDIYILPHPLIGKLTIREMAYFTIYHVEHHHNLVKQYSNAS